MSNYPSGSASITQLSIFYDVLLSKIFTRARSSDEFEYACALINFSGIKGPGWHPEVESQKIIGDLRRLASESLSGHTQIRLLLFAYLHIFEMDVTYALIMNMLRIISGDRYTMRPFVDRNGEIIEKSSAKIDKITSLASTLNLYDCEKIFDWHEPRLRNSFAHSNYDLFNDHYNITYGKTFIAEGVLSPSISIEQEIIPRLNGSFRFVTAFFNAWGYARLQFSENKIVRGRIAHDGSYMDVELIADCDSGLQGFVSPPRSILE